jgi:hypothetical protein
MHLMIDILAAVVLLFFLLAGWHRGLLLSLLGVVRVILAYGAAFFAGRHIGFWLGGAVHRPRIVTIPVTAGMTFLLITFIFHITMSEIRSRHHKKEEEEGYRHSTTSSLGGAGVSFLAGILSLTLLFWIGDLFMVGTTGTGIPGADRAFFSRFARRSVYETALRIGPARADSLQSSSIARMVSNPAEAMQLIERILSAESMQQLAADAQLPADLLSGDAERIGRNPAIQRLFDDHSLLKDLRDLGVLSGHETRDSLCHTLATVGRNEKIRASVEGLKARGLLSTDKILPLIRDPEFDVIVAELVR